MSLGFAALERILEDQMVDTRPLVYFSVGMIIPRMMMF
jgi:hypothetical protein